MPSPSQVADFDNLPLCIETARTTLVHFTTDHVTDDYLSWFHDELVVQHLESRKLSRADVIEHLERGLRNHDYRIYAICSRDSGRHIGNVKLGPILWQHGVSDLVTVIGDRQSWGKGLATEVIASSSRVAFDHLKLRKLSGGIASGNDGSVKAYTRAGWVVEAVLKGQVVSDGQVRDKILVGCFNPDFFPSHELSGLGHPIIQPSEPGGSDGCDRSKATS